MTAPKINFDWTITLGSIVSTAMWVAGAVWFVSTLTAAVDQLRLDNLRQDSAIERLEVNGSQIARLDNKRIEILEKRQDLTESTLRTMSETLARIDENVKTLRESNRERQLRQ